MAHRLISCWTHLVKHHEYRSLWNLTSVWQLVTWVSTSQHQSFDGASSEDLDTVREAGMWSVKTISYDGHRWAIWQPCFCRCWAWSLHHMVDDKPTLQMSDHTTVTQQPLEVKLRLVDNVSGEMVLGPLRLMVRLMSFKSLTYVRWCQRTFESLWSEPIKENQFQNQVCQTEYSWKNCNHLIDMCSRWRWQRSWTSRPLTEDDVPSHVDDREKHREKAAAWSSPKGARKRTKITA